MNDLFSRSMRALNSDLSRDEFNDVELGNGKETAKLDQAGNLKAFFDEVDEVKNQMAQVKQLLVKLQHSHQESLTLHKAAAMKALAERMEKDMQEVGKMARSIKQKLEELDRATVESRKIPGCEEGTPNDRSRTSIINAERKKLRDVLEGFQLLREKIKTDYKETIERRYFTVTGEKADDATIEHIIDTGESENFLQKAIQEQGRGQILETVREIQERHDAVIDIERSLLELNSIFLEMSVLVEAQGVQINSIEQNVLKAKAHVDSGTQALVRAKRYQRSSRKCMCIAIILLLIIIAIIVVPILTTTRK